MTDDEAHRFAESWVAAWNAHDLDQVLSHFTDDVVFASPLVPTLTGKDNPLHGQAELRAYWEEGLRRLPDLHFTLESVFHGAGSVAVAYRNERGRRCLEVLVLADGHRAGHGWALYGDTA
jgi:ketosteroid isomerase-like protein